MEQSKLNDLSVSCANHTLSCTSAPVLGRLGERRQEKDNNRLMKGLRWLNPLVVTTRRWSARNKDLQTSWDTKKRDC